MNAWTCFDCNQLSFEQKKMNKHVLNGQTTFNSHMSRNSDTVETIFLKKKVFQTILPTGVDTTAEI